VIAAAAALVILTFTPVIIYPGKAEPALFSLPYTLWTSMVITVILVWLTYVASRLRDDENDRP